MGSVVGVRGLVPSPYFAAMFAAACVIWLVGSRSLFDEQDLEIAPTKLTFVHQSSDIDLDHALFGNSERLSPDNARPLFSPTRRPVVFGEPVSEREPVENEIEPPAPVVEEQEEPPLEPPRVVLVGALRSKIGWLALLRHDRSDRERWYKLGDSIEGWSIKSIESQKILLERDSIELTLKLYN